MAFIELAKSQWLIRLSKSLPPGVLNNYWPPCPYSCREASEHLRVMHKLWKARCYRIALSKQDKEQFELKILAESLFKGKKKSYAKSLGPRFITDRLGVEHKALRQSFTNNILSSGESIKVEVLSKKKKISVEFKRKAQSKITFSSTLLPSSNTIGTVTNRARGC